MNEWRRVERDGEHTIPVDSVARRVAGKGEEPPASGVPRNDNNLGRTDIPYTTKPRPRTIRNLIGMRHGWIRIVGYLGAGGRLNSRQKKHRWLGRCNCGNHVVREGYKWRRRSREGPDDPVVDMCGVCRRRETIRHKEAVRGTVGLREEMHQCPWCADWCLDLMYHAEQCNEPRDAGEFQAAERDGEWLMLWECGCVFWYVEGARDYCDRHAAWRDGYVS